MAQTQQEASGPTTNSSEPLRATDHRPGDLHRTAPLRREKTTPRNTTTMRQPTRHAVTRSHHEKNGVLSTLSA